MGGWLLKRAHVARVGGWFLTNQSSMEREREIQTYMYDNIKQLERVVMTVFHSSLLSYSIRILMLDCPSLFSQFSHLLVL